MYHIEVNPNIVRDIIGVPGNGVQYAGAGVAVVWFTVKDGMEGKFVEGWEALKGKGEHMVCGGWKIEKGEEGTGVFVMFCGLKDGEEGHFEVESLDGFSLVKDLVTDVKVKHMIPWTGEIEDM